MSGLDLQERLRVAAANDSVMLLISGEDAARIVRGIEQAEKMSGIASRALALSRETGDLVVREASSRMRLTWFALGAVYGAAAALLIMVTLP